MLQLIIYLILSFCLKQDETDAMVIKQIKLCDSGFDTRQANDNFY